MVDSVAGLPFGNNFKELSDENTGKKGGGERRRKKGAYENAWRVSVCNDRESEVGRGSVWPR